MTCRLTQRWRDLKLFGVRFRTETQCPGGDDRLGAVGCLEGAEDCRNVNFHRRLGKVERAADCLVALTLHHQGEHLHLPGRREWRFDGTAPAWAATGGCSQR